MQTQLQDWLAAELHKRGWTMSELSRRSGVSHVQIGYVLRGERKAGVDFCTAIAPPLGVPPSEVLKLAGYLPASYAPKRDSITRLLEAAASLSDADVEELATLARMRAQRATTGNAVGHSGA